MKILIVIYIALVLIYLIRTIFFFNGARKERAKKVIDATDDNLPYVSVVIPARDEEKNIGKCLESIMKNDYPENKYEIIVVNDRSKDNTGNILKSYKNKIKNLLIVNLTSETKDPNLRGKPGALHHGIEISKGEIILMTDADCTVSKKWIRKMTSAYLSNSDVGLVSGFTHVNGRRIFKLMQAVEWCYMHTMALAGVGMNNPLGCFGNNLSVSKKVFYEIGGYKSIKFSVTEDLALQKAVFKNGHMIRYLNSKDSLVTTNPVENFKEYLRQRHRWAIGGIDLGWDAAFFVSSSVAVWIALIIALIIMNNYLIFGIITFRVICDYSLIIPSLKAIEKRWLITWIVPSVLFFMIMEIVVPFLLLKKNVVWKDQVFVTERKSSKKHEII